MPNIGILLKEEITRLSRKTVKVETTALREAVTKQRKEIADLKRQIAAVEKSVRASQKSVAKVAKTEIPELNESAPRFQVRGVVSLRERLGLSQQEFGTLVGVSAISIYNWETGRATPRGKSLESLASLRGIGKKEARNRLDAITAA